MKKYYLTAGIITMCLLLTACGNSNTSDSFDEQTQTASATESTTNKSDDELSTSSDINASKEMFTKRDYETGYDETDATTITLNGTSATSSSDNVSISGNTITISAKGTYIISGSLTNGSIIIDAPKDDKLQIVLNGVSINNNEGAAIYVRQADKVFMTLVAGSTNSLSNGGNYTKLDDNTIDAVIFSKEDLTINGNGTLTIKAALGHGVVSKDDLVITSGAYNITAASHGISGKNSVRIADGNVNINCGKDGIHAEEAVYIAGGTTNITKSYEGIEGLYIDILGGSINILASDDGLNAAGGNDSSGFGDSAVEGCYINIAGGSININASGDGIDSNGLLTIFGGETFVAGPTNDGNGALDYNGDAVITGGILVAAGSSGMAQNMGTASTQGSILVSTGSQSANTAIELTDSDGSSLISWTSPKSYSCVVISCPGIKKGETYTLKAGSSTNNVTMSSLIYGSGGMGSGGKGPGGKNPGGKGPGGY